MKNDKMGVLAVMDASAGRERLDNNGHHAVRMDEARAAMTELIVVSEEVVALWPSVMCVCGRNHSRIPDGLRARLRAALARVGGAA